ncbi:MAG TPA: 2-dehydropantoate 2-reductase [Chthonomonadaceae bacterium]|nr:2-dehydropantoate 2-reductase [Chthonomonadaceae bacterium]
MKIAILGGAGAMGSALGALLFEAGNDVTLVDVAQKAVEAIHADGLIIEGKDGTARTVRVPATTDPASIGPVELVIVFVKCYHTEAAVRSAAPLLGPDTVVLSLQNGWGNAPRIATIVGPERVVVGVTYHSATVRAPGRVLHAGKGPTFLGEIGQPVSGRVQNIAETFQAADIPALPSNTVLEEIWKKLALNAATLPTSATIGITADRLLDTPEMQGLMQALLKEVVAVANAQGISLDFTERWQAISGLLGRLAPGTKGSMLQDVENRRQTEIDVINGAIVAAGEQTGIPTPYSRAIVALVKALERSFAGHS